MKELIIYHGSDHIIEKPEFGKGKAYNDYGQGFYCTEYDNLAKEWACDVDHDGYANKYKLDLDGLNILDLESNEYTILHWISILLKNRRFDLDSDIAVAAKEYILKNFEIDTAGYDIIKGYRADDSYFSFARDFLQNSISVSKLESAMKLGNLGTQIVLVSPKAFEHIKFVEASEALSSEYYPQKKMRDEYARATYLSSKKNNVFDKDQLYIVDIIRNEIKGNDPRI